MTSGATTEPTRPCSSGATRTKMPTHSRTRSACTTCPPGASRRWTICRSASPVWAVKRCDWLPPAFRPSGVPSYDFARGVVLAEGVQRPMSSGGCQVLADDSDEAIITLGVEPFHSHSICGIKGGKPAWSYPSPWPGLHASHHAAKPDRPGQIIGTTRLLGRLRRAEGIASRPAVGGQRQHGQPVSLHPRRSVRRHRFRRRPSGQTLEDVRGRARDEPERHLAARRELLADDQPDTGRAGLPGRRLEQQPRAAGRSGDAAAHPTRHGCT